MYRDDEILTTTEAIKYLKTSRQTLFKLIKEGKIRCNKLGKNYRFVKIDLEKFVRGETEEPKAAAK